MNIVDIAIVLVIGASLIIGLIRGFIREVFSLVCWVLAFGLAYYYAAEGAVYLESVEQPLSVRVGLAFFFIFITTLLLFSIASYWIYKMLVLANISSIDRLLGATYGVLRGVILVTFLVIAANFMDFQSKTWWQDSQLVERFSGLAETYVQPLVPDDLVDFLTPDIL